MPYDKATSTRGEMDITTGFGPVIVGSSPAGCTSLFARQAPGYNGSELRI